ncbi:restriction endonuclease subunit S [Xanthomonas oryzae]|uniref:Type I restriction endonuclease subunit S n=2 Tax=Xanthomonas oryzae TaxID=347 RepID=A0AAJ5SQN5_XANOO|nr:restriction endonuclease subunit S [Xanthomonas oryzae]QIE21897.1 type I restriction endonuclease subunit S [Xanthomonas oryzae pv. oryzae]UXV80933.1 type I restriction endonuclease subunit S [Xanthomonas oryzae pv. oryzae]UXW03566.1 type I restriction endonuclease subunit S [Xanthomonas oryzae pv. oryzae]UXW18253.1 restriction endonuclease subunit S [Xanthomonas oryzae pv. oryzae]UXW22055.1 restriction endonuclease subunit S [Xanthomonas oryzae pv. oryzae]
MRWMVSELPGGWVETTIGEICAMGPKSAWDDGMEIGFVPMSHAPTNFRGPLNYEARRWHEVKKAYTHFENDDVIFAKVTPCFENGKAALVAGLPNGAGAGSSEFHVLRRRDAGISPSYLLAVIKSAQFLREGEENMTGAVGLRRVPRAFVENFPVRLPPEAEQKRIAQKLDALLAQVDTLKARIDDIPALLKRFRQSVINHGVSGSLALDQHASFDTTTWRNMRAEDVCTKVQSGGTPKEGFTTEGIPFLKVYNIVDGIIEFEYRPQYIAANIHQGSCRKSITIPGDVLMNIVGPPLGKIAVVPQVVDEWNINQAITLFRPSESISSAWIHLVLLEGTNIRRVSQETKGSAGQVNISLSQCRDFVFPVPPTQIQDEIVRRVEQLFAYADQLEAKVAAAQQRIDALTQSLLAKAFRGELVPQDPTDEPASVLLERIRTQRAATPKPKRGRKAATS